MARRGGPLPAGRRRYGDTARKRFAGGAGGRDKPGGRIQTKVREDWEETVSDRPWSSTAPVGEFQPYVPTEQRLAEFSLRAVVLGGLFGLLFGAVTVYVGLRAGLTVSASIPISVLSISILRAFGRSTILENNIVQTTGSAGESLAAGVMFTIPALIFLGFGSEFTFWRIFPLALLRGRPCRLFL